MPRIIPFGDRILVKRRKVGEKIGSLYVSDDIKDSKTDIADVLYVPDLTFGDSKILENAEKVIESLLKKACEGDDKALEAALKLNDFVKVKSIKEGDVIMVGKYVGVDFVDNRMQLEYTLIREQDIIGLVGSDDGK